MTAPFPRDEPFEKNPCLAGRSTYVRIQRLHARSFEKEITLIRCRLFPVFDSREFGSEISQNGLYTCLQMADLRLVRSESLFFSLFAGNIRLMPLARGFPFDFGVNGRPTTTLFA